MKTTITRKQDKDTYDKIAWCVKAKEKDAYGWHNINLLCVNQRRLIATDGHRIHLARVNLPDGIYDYHKTKSAITLEKTTFEEFPNVSNFIPKTYAHKVTVKRKELLRRCKQAKIISSDQYQGITLNFNGRLDIKAVNPDIGDMTAHTDIDQPVDPEITIGMNVKYLIDALTGLQGNEVTIGLQGMRDKQRYSDKIMIIRNHTQAALIMPMRV